MSTCSWASSPNRTSVVFTEHLVAFSLTFIAYASKLNLRHNINFFITKVYHFIHLASRKTKKVTKGGTGFKQIITREYKGRFVSGYVQGYLGKRMARGYRFYVKWVCPMESYAWGIQVFCSRKEAPPHFKPPPWTEHLNISGITSVPMGQNRFTSNQQPLAILFPRSQPVWLFSEGILERQSL